MRPAAVTLNLGPRQRQFLRRGVLFSITYTDASGVNAATFDSSDVLVSKSGFSQLATFVSATPSGNGTTIAATYSFAAPGGTRIGTYTLTLQSNQVGDIVSNLLGTAVLGTIS